MILIFFLTVWPTSVLWNLGFLVVTFIAVDELAKGVAGTGALLVRRQEHFVRQFLMETSNIIFKIN